MAVDDWWYWGHRGPRLGDVAYRATLHQVREPLAAIAAMTRLDKPAFWHWQQVHTGIGRDEPSPIPEARFWLDWNLRCEAAADMTYRVEDVEDAWGEIAARLGVSAECPTVEPRGRTGGERREVTWDELKSCDAALAKEIRSLACRYGYEV